MNAGQQQENKSCTAKNGHDVASPIITELGQADSNMLPLYELQVTATRALHFTVRNAMRKLCSICGKVDFDNHKRGCQGSGVEKNGYACTRQQQTTICKTHCRLDASDRGTRLHQHGNSTALGLHSLKLKNGTATQNTNKQLTIRQDHHVLLPALEDHREQ